MVVERSGWRAAKRIGPFKCGRQVHAGVATGVASQFLDLLDHERRTARRQTVVAVSAAVLLLIPAALVLPWAGLAVHPVAVGLGIVAGLMLAARLTRAYELSLKERWQRWMRFAVAAESLPEIARKVAGRTSRNRNAAIAAGLVVLWVLEVALLLLALDGQRSAWLAVPVLLFNGLLSGLLIGHYRRLGSWAGQLRGSMDEMLKSGELGLWGVV